MTRTNRESITFFRDQRGTVLDCENTRGGDRTHNLRLREPTRFHCATRALHKPNGVMVMLGLEPRTFALSERRSTD